MCDWRYNLTLFGDYFISILLEAQNECRIEWTEEQARVQAEQLLLTPFSKKYNDRLVREFDVVGKCDQLAEQALDFISFKSS